MERFMSTERGDRVQSPVRNCPIFWDASRGSVRDLFVPIKFMKAAKIEIGIIRNLQ